jgi:hypothetical protein
MGNEVKFPGSKLRDTAKRPNTRRLASSAKCFKGKPPPPYRSALPPTLICGGTTATLQRGMSLGNSPTAAVRFHVLKLPPLLRISLSESRGLRVLESRHLGKLITKYLFVCYVQYEATPALLYGLSAAPYKCAAPRIPSNQFHHQISWSILSLELLHRARC